MIAIALTFASGAADVTSFTRLGSVFTSVMTGNIVLWGLAVARGSLTLFSHTAVSIAGYITGVAAGDPDRAPRQDARDRPGRPAGGHVIWVLRTELTLLAGFAVGWEMSGAAPAGWAQFGLLATLAAAMGMQSAAVNDMGLAQVSTTFLTGTLTGLVSSLVSPGKDTPDRLRRFGVAGRAGGRGQPGRPAGRDRARRGARPAAGRADHHPVPGRPARPRSPALPGAFPGAGRDRGSSLPAGGT